LFSLIESNNSILANSIIEDLIQKLKTFLATFLVAKILIFCIYFTNITCKLAGRKRQDELFDRRYKFLKSI